MAAIVVGLLVLVFVVLQLTGIGGKHGPGRHMSGASMPDIGTPGIAQASVATLLG
ncbi:hypothetical protein [Blastococcus brunescens]|uniref:Protein-export membrane protein SecG n=1 Tax=Blastococcus brunescens TaxID=1564165 RepID=A0ABZ1B6C2_9ACTN|nr:hypothetical protein [Blastococcus sp. BMG 8361]WRL65676.1 hypothetical protein U6N30_08895 [Blastococcus sp. BMG 8361]